MRYLITLLLCLYCSTAWAFPPGFIGAVTSGQSAGGDSCTGSLAMSSHFENNDDLTVGGGCIVSGGDNTWTRDSNCAYANTTPSPFGGYYADCTGTTNAATHKASITNTNLPLSTGTVCASLYMVSTQGADAFPVTYDAANEYALKLVWQSGTSDYQARGIAGASTVADTSNFVSRDTWTRVCFSWDSTPAAGSQKQGVKVGSNAWVTLTNKTFSDPTVTNFALGAPYGSYIRGYVDAVKLYTDFAHAE